MKALIADGRMWDIVSDDQVFEVADTMHWIDVPDDAASNSYSYDGTSIIPIVAEVPTQAELIAQIKRIAQQKIYAVIPSWKQANLTARSTELLRMRIDAGSWTTDQSAEANAIDLVWEKAKAIRSYSNTLEASILSGDFRDITLGWPE